MKRVPPPPIHPSRPRARNPFAPPAPPVTAQAKTRLARGVVPPPVGGASALARPRHPVPPPAPFAAAAQAKAPPMRHAPVPPPPVAAARGGVAQRASQESKLPRKTSDPPAPRPPTPKSTDVKDPAPPGGAPEHKAPKADTTALASAGSVAYENSETGDTVTVTADRLCLCEITWDDEDIQAFFGGEGASVGELQYSLIDLAPKEDATKTVKTMSILDIDAGVINRGGGYILMLHGCLRAKASGALFACVATPLAHATSFYQRIDLMDAQGREVHMVSIDTVITKTRIQLADAGWSRK